jgi:hypothetical protein
VLLTRAPLYSPPEGRFRVRLACLRHAASVDSEPGSNSRYNLILEHNLILVIVSDYDSSRVLNASFIARRLTLKVINMDTLYLVFKDRFQLHRIQT